MANVNCLEGMMCPACGSEEPFRIVVTTTVLMYDEGSEHDKMGGNLEWEDASYCECYACHHTGTVKDFQDPPTVACKFCDEHVLAKTAHLHQGSWVGDICCWTEKLRASA